MDIKLAIVTSSLCSKGGSERKIFEIARHMKSPVYCYDYDAEGTYEGFKDIEVHCHAPGRQGVSGIMGRIDQVRMANYFHNLKLDGYDAFCAGLAPSELIRNRNSPVIWYCFTPYRFVYDLHEWRMRSLSPIQRPVYSAWSSIYRWADGRVVPRIEHIFTNSVNTQARIKKYLGRDSEVLYSGIDSGRFRCAGFERFFFYPSRIDPLKEFEFAIEAFRRFNTDGGWKLVIAGSLSKQPGHADYLRWLKSIAGVSVEFETDVSEERMRDLYSRCYATLYSPREEDFGNVPFESMASSKPCIARNEGGPKESIRDGVDGFLVDSPVEMAQRMDHLAKDPEACASMGKAGRRKVAEFTWERFLRRFEEKAKELVEAKSNR
jgi:glycosyltransferase involved in cell wall biosynthesis